MGAGVRAGAHSCVRRLGFGDRATLIDAKRTSVADVRARIDDVYARELALHS